MPLPELSREIAAIFAVELTALRQGSRRKELIDARGALCFIATRKMGMSGGVVAKALTISRSGVLVAARRGEEIYAKFPELQKLVESSQPNHLRPL
jgi:nitrous oxide reductase accessory protein NosL